MNICLYIHTDRLISMCIYTYKDLKEKSHSFIYRASNDVIKFKGAMDDTDI